MKDPATFPTSMDTIRKGYIGEFEDFEIYKPGQPLMTPTPIEKWCEENSAKIATQIDEAFYLVIYPRPKWCPRWLYNKIIKASVGVVNIMK